MGSFDVDLGGGLAVGITSLPRIVVGVDQLPKVQVGLDPLDFRVTKLPEIEVGVTKLPEIEVGITKLPKIEVAIDPLELRWTELPSIRVHLPADFHVGLAFLGHELFGIRLCGEAQVITEPYVPHPCEVCEPPPGLTSVQKP